MPLAGLFFLVQATDGQIQFKKPKSEPHLPNPLIIGASRDEIRSVAKQVLETREIPIDKEECNQQTGECNIISKPVVFIKGIATRSQLEHYCEVPAAHVHNWTRGRYSLRIQISPNSPKAAQVGVYARFEGMTDGVLVSEWIPLSSKGELEDALLRCLDQRAKGGECQER
jgi:hypothetical protein